MRIEGKALFFTTKVTKDTRSILGALGGLGGSISYGATLMVVGRALTQPRPPLMPKV